MRMLTVRGAVASSRDAELPVPSRREPIFGVALGATAPPLMDVIKILDRSIAGKFALAAMTSRMFLRRNVETPRLPHARPALWPTLSSLKAALAAERVTDVSMLKTTSKKTPPVVPARVAVGVGTPRVGVGVPVGVPVPVCVDVCVLVAVGESEAVGETVGVTVVDGVSESDAPPVVREGVGVGVGDSVLDTVPVPVTETPAAPVLDVVGVVVTVREGV